MGLTGLNGRRLWIAAGRRAIALASVGVVGLWSVAGQAQDKKPAQAAKKSRVVTISEVTIVGRIQKPIAAVDVSRIAPKLTLAKLHHPFLHKVEEAIYRAPF